MKSNGALKWFFCSIIVILISGSSVPISKQLIENQKIGMLYHGGFAFTVVYDDPSWLWVAPFIRSLPASSIIVVVTDSRTGTVKQISCKREGGILLCK